MNTRIRTLIAVAACALAVAAAPKAHAQSQAKLLVKATAGTPIVNVIVDTSQGTGLDSKGAAGVAQQFANTDWLILDNGQLVIAKGDKAVLVANFFTNKDLTFFLVHRKAQNLDINGTIFRSSQNPQQGFGELFVTVPLQNNQGYATLHIQAELSFAGTQSQPDPGNGSGGFGSFGGN
jgi:hypothetical protein